MGGLTVAVRLALYVAVSGLFGTAALGLYAPAAFALVRPRGALIATVSVGLAATVLGLGALAAQMTGAVAGAVDLNTLTMVATRTAAGRATLVRFGVLAVDLIILIRWPTLGDVKVAVVAGFAGVATASLAWGGHAAGSEGGVGLLRLFADVLHLLAAGIWLGALAAFLCLIRRADQDPAGTVMASLTQFAGVGSGVVALLLLTGAINLVLALGWNHLADVTATLWGRLLLIKLGLFTVMIGLAALNRFRLTPALADAATREAAQAALRRSLMVETACALLVIALVAWLGTLSPLPGA